MATNSSIKYDMDLSSTATGAGGMTLLSTQTASSSSTISFTSGIAWRKNVQKSSNRLIIIITNIPR